MCGDITLCHFKVKAQDVRHTGRKQCLNSIEVIWNKIAAIKVGASEDLVGTG